MPTIPCKCGNATCQFEDHASAVAEFCNHYTITVFADIVDDSGRLVEPLTMERLSRLIANKAGVPEYVPLVRHVRTGCDRTTGDDIEDVGLYAISIDAGGDHKYETNLWVVPRGDSDPDVTFTHYEEGTPAYTRLTESRQECVEPQATNPPLTQTQTAALAWAIGRLSGGDDPCNFCAELEELLLLHVRPAAD